MTKNPKVNCPDCGTRTKANLRYPGFDEDGNRTEDVEEIEEFGSILLSECAECGHVKPRNGR